MHVDFNQIEPAHAEIHGRLENWARWCRGRPNSSILPMFRMVKADFHWEGQDAAIPIDKIDAQKIAKGVSALPRYHMLGVNWFYVSPCSPRKAAVTLGTNLEGLALFVRDGRQMLKNRGV